MKNKIKAIALTLATAALSSCGNDWLDLTPANGLPTDGAITNYADALVARSGMYDGLQGNSTDNDYYATRMFYYGDVSGDDMQARTQGMRSSSAYEKRFTLDDAPTIWKTPYNVIRRANRIIEAIDQNKIGDATKEQLGKLNAEALTIRALVHFDLVKVYGKPYTMDNGASLGVPVVLTPLTGENLPGRSTVAEVYTQVINDLTNAIKSGFLATENTTPGYINVWAAKALLCRVYLYHNDNTKSLETAKDIIENSGYKLWENDEYVKGWQTNVQKGRSEMLFEIANFSSDDWADREGIAYLLNENGYADAIVTQSFTDLLNEDPDDVRHGITLAASIDEDLMKEWKEAKIFINKFPADESGEMRLNSLPILRLSEVYLNAAEAAVKENNPDAQIYLDRIVNRSNTKKHVSQSETTLTRVLQERRRELVGEGQRFFDAMRNNETIVRYTETNNRGRHYPLNKESQKFDNTYFRAILPIPVTEVNANPILRAQQNPGY